MHEVEDGLWLATFYVEEEPWIEERWSYSPGVDAERYDVLFIED